MEIELWNGASKAIVDPRGAWLTNLSDERGDILFPRRLFKNAAGETKTRGGCHVCLPNFGPGGKSGQPQHGFGREMDWTVSDKTDDSVLLTLPGGKNGYEKMSAELSYQLAEHALVVTLDVINNGQADLRVAPAFHPYFAILGDGDVQLNGEKLLLDELGDTVFTSGNEQKLHVPNREFALLSERMPVWAQWTDQLGSYVCVEPTVSGYAFLEESPGEGELLQPGQTKDYIFRVLWE